MVSIISVPTLPYYREDIYPGSNKKRGGEICCFTSFVVTNFTKLKMILFLNSYEKKIIILIFTEKTVTKLLEIWLGIRDPRSEIQDP